MAWGKGLNEETEFNQFCEKIATNKTASSSLSVLKSRFGGKWNELKFASKLCNALKTNNSLEELYCSGLDFTSEDCEELAFALQQNTHLRKLLFGRTETFSDTHLEKLFKFTTLGKVEYLDLEKRNLTWQSGKILGEAIGHNQTNLITINISFNQLGDQGLHHFSKCFSKFTKVKVLILRNNDISLDGIKSLVNEVKKYDNICFERLDLSENPGLGPLGIAALATVSADELLLDHCRGGDAGCTALLLGKPRKLLSLSDNDLTSRGALKIAELAFLCPNIKDHIHSLRLSKNINIGNEGVVAISNILESRRIFFPEANSIEVLDISQVSATRLPNQLLTGIITSLIFSGNGPLNHVELTECLSSSQNSTLTSLALSGTGIKNISAVFEALHHHPALTTVEFGGIRLTAADRQSLAILKEQNPKLDVAVDRGEHESEN